MLFLQKLGLKEMKMEQQAKFPLRLDAISNVFDYIKEAVELDGSQLAREMYEKAKVILKPSCNFFNPDQLAMVFTWLGFEIELLAAGPGPYYLLECGNHDQVRLVARKPSV